MLSGLWDYTNLHWVIKNPVNFDHVLVIKNRSKYPTPILKLYKLRQNFVLYHYKFAPNDLFIYGFKSHSSHRLISKSDSFSAVGTHGPRFWIINSVTRLGNSWQYLFSQMDQIFDDFLGYLFRKTTSRWSKNCCGYFNVLNVFNILNFFNVTNINSITNVINITNVIIITNVINIINVTGMGTPSSRGSRRRRETSPTSGGRASCKGPILLNLFLS